MVAQLYPEKCKRGKREVKYGRKKNVCGKKLQKKREQGRTRKKNYYKGLEGGNAMARKKNPSWSIWLKMISWEKPFCSYFLPFSFSFPLIPPLWGREMYICGKERGGTNALLADFIILGAWSKNGTDMIIYILMLMHWINISWLSCIIYNLWGIHSLSNLRTGGV